MRLSDMIRIPFFEGSSASNESQNLSRECSVASAKKKGPEMIPQWIANKVAADSAPSLGEGFSSFGGGHPANNMTTLEVVREMPFLMVCKILEK